MKEAMVLRTSWNSNFNHPSYEGWHQKLMKRNFENNPMRRKIRDTSGNLTKDFAYIVGVLKGDGSLICDNSSSWRLSLAVNSIDFAKKFKRICEKWSGL